MHKKQEQALVTQVATHDIFGQFRYFKNDDGEIWFVGVDIAKILGYKNCSRDLRRHVEPEDMKVVKLSTETVGNFGGNPNKVIINESGLYSLIFGSKLPEAKKFTHWVTSEVLPQIRKTGSYSLPEKKPVKTITAAEYFINVLKENPDADFYVSSITFEKEEDGHIYTVYNIGVKK